MKNKCVDVWMTYPVYEIKVSKLFSFKCFSCCCFPFCCFYSFNLLLFTVVINCQLWIINYLSQIEALLVILVHWTLNGLQNNWNIFWFDLGNKQGKMTLGNVLSEFNKIVKTNHAKCVVKINNNTTKHYIIRKILQDCKIPFTVTIFLILYIIRCSCVI